MSTLNELLKGLAQAWRQLAEGWRDLGRRTSQALTRFHAPPSSRFDR